MNLRTIGDERFADGEEGVQIVSEGIEVSNIRVPDVRFSDHRPIVCDFKVRS